MKKTVKFISAMLMAMAASAFAQSSASIAVNPPQNPATGIWIQQVGDIVPHASTKATLYYTKFRQSDRVKSVSYQYNGNGYLLINTPEKETLCTTGKGVQGADGIAHHPDGDLLVAGQEKGKIYKVSKTDKNACLVKSAGPYTAVNGFWHLMMEPQGKILWAAGIPGPLYRFSTDTASRQPSYFAEQGYHVTISPDMNDAKTKNYIDKYISKDKRDQIATIIWDGDNQAYFTYSDYKGGGCEGYNNELHDFVACDENARASARKGVYFGYISDTVKTYVSKKDTATLGGKAGDSVITELKTRVLLESLEGAHGGTYDPYSNTIFVFGGARIVQIRPGRDGNGKPTAEVVATIDMRDYFFVEDFAHMPKSYKKENGDTVTIRTNDGGWIGWRLDQGTVDGRGHLFVASNTGHLVFVDYAANPNKLINDNMLIHVQWIDNYLDDLAPLAGAGVVRQGAQTGEDEELSSSSRSSSSMVEYHESSSSAKSSSSKNNGSSSSGNVGSSGSNGDNPGSSGSNGGSSGSNGDNPGSSGSNGGSSGSNGDNPGSSGSNVGSSGSNGDNPGSSGSNGGSSGSNGENPGSSGSNVGSSGSNGGNSSSSGSNGGGNHSGSSSSKGSGSGDDITDKSSSSRFSGSGDDIADRYSSSYFYYGGEDFDVDEEDVGLDAYPTTERFEMGDSIVSKTVVMKYTADTTNPKAVVINGNHYLLTSNPDGEPLDLRFNSGLDSAKVGEVIAITLDKEKVKKYFDSPDSITVLSQTGVQIIDPRTGEKSKQVTMNADGSVTIFVTADEVVEGGSIKVFGGNEMVIIDNINFYDPIPDTRVGYIKDTDGDMDLDYVEILLKDTLSSTYFLDDVKIVIGKDTLDCVNPDIRGDRIIVSVEELALPGVSKFPKDAKALIVYGDHTREGVTYLRETSLIEVGSNVIKEAYAIRDAKGLDSLFLKFNIDLMPVDVSTPDLLVMLKQESKRYGLDVQKVYMPAKDIVILVGKSFNLKGNDRDSVSLYPNVSFESLQYITSDEYEREIKVKVVDRLPSAKNVEYWDTDGDGVLDQIVTVFNKKLTAADIDKSLYMSFPWYSSRGLLIQLQAQPSNLRIDPKDSTRIIWDVISTTTLAKGVTSISEKLPEANVYTYYSIFGETFVNEESAPLVDKLSPMVASATLSYGKKADTLLVVFTEPVVSKGLRGNDYFSYIHGKDTIDLVPTRIDWSADGLSAKLVFSGSQGTILPGDSLMIHHGAKDAIKDNYGNIAGENPQSVIIGGLLNHLVESVKMGSFDANDDRVGDEDSNKTYTLQTVSSVNLRYVPGTTTKEDMEKEGALGQLVQLGERFVPQLLDAAQVSADGSFDPTVLDSIKPEDVYISFIVHYFDHLGQYVNDTVITVPCESPKFGGNCLETDKKVFVNWNFKDHKGRFVGTGIYNVQFKMIVRYENKKIQEEIKDKWGVRRKKHKK